jgi:hypothetical protein
MIDEMLHAHKRKSGEAMPPVVDNEDIQSELDRILASEFFKSSARCREFLKYVVEVKCSDTHEPLKERMIGITVFGRSPDYDTGTDAIVRVKANDVRRRLAQYNLSADPGRSVAIELNPGSYEPRISRIQPEAEESTVGIAPEKTEPYLKHKKILPGASIAVTLLAAIFLIRILLVSASPLGKFWRPFLGHNQPIICVSHRGFYNILPDKFVGKGDAPEAFLLRDYLRKEGRSSRIGIADDLSPSDFKASPAVLLGGPRFNRWTLAFTQNLRFAFDAVDGRPRIIDRDNLQRFWQDNDPVIGEPFSDYVIITRLQASESAKSILCIAGLNAVGSKKGTALIVDSEALKRILKYAPDDWDKKNLQLVLRVTVDENKPDNIELVAATYW